MLRKKKTLALQLRAGGKGYFLSSLHTCPYIFVLAAPLRGSTSHPLYEVGLLLLSFFFFATEGAQKKDNSKGQEAAKKR